MSHFIYAMRADDPAPATGGDTKSWFYYYKWDVDDFAYVPVDEAAMLGFDPKLDGTDVLWFVLDGALLGCVPIHAVMPSLSGKVELHYHTNLIQAVPESAQVQVNDQTGLAGDQNLFAVLKRSFDAQYPPRLAAGVGLMQSK